MRSYHVAAQGVLFCVGKVEPAKCAEARADAWDFLVHDYGGLFASHRRSHQRGFETRVVEKSRGLREHKRRESAIHCALRRGRKGHSASALRQLSSIW